MPKEGGFLLRLSEDYGENTAFFDGRLRVGENFDVIKKVLAVGQGEVTVYYIDGLFKDGALQKLLTYLLSVEKMPETAEAFLRAHMPYVESDVVRDAETLVTSALTGMAILLGSTFGAAALCLDVRTSPARSTAEPENDRVMRGARDGFVETIIFNTALIRRRIRDASLVMHAARVGRASGTDVVVCYMKGRADPRTVRYIKARVHGLDTDALTLGHQSLAETLIRTHWYNPFPKIRYTERPDTAAAQLLEGGVIVLIDNSPAAMILPTGIFDFLQESNDYYLPPLTGTYLRVVRHAVFWLTLFLTPLWFLETKNPDVVPDFLAFTIPNESGRLPLFWQLLLAEFIIDGLRMASMNTPDMLTNSLSAVGGLLLGDFAISVGWLIPEVVLYMAFVAIANSTQSSFELGYALKFMRILLLVLTQLFNVWGFLAGLALTLTLIVTNKTINGGRSYLYPLVPFSGRALLALYTRRKKRF